MAELICKNKRCAGKFHKDEETGALTQCPILYANEQIDMLRLYGFGFSDFDLSFNEDPKIIEKVQGFLSGKYLQLILRGENGRGKTHLAKAVVREYLKRLKPCGLTMDAMFIRMATDIFAEDPNDRHAARMYLDRLKKTPIVLFDDLGSRPYTIHSLTILQEVMDSRLTGGLKTIYTTNLTAKKVRITSGVSTQEQKEWVSRIESRLHHATLDIKVSGKDYRKEGKLTEVIN